MQKLRIRLVAVTYFKDELNLDRVVNWKSKLFKVVDKKDYCPNMEPDIEETWGYTDSLLEKELLPAGHDVDFTVYVLDAPLEDEYFSRIISENRIVVTYYDIKEKLYEASIPYENLIISLMYTYTFVFLAKKGTYMYFEDEKRLSHATWRGCIFDECGITEQVVRLCVSPIICEDSKKTLSENGVSSDVIYIAEKEMKRLKRYWYNGLERFLKRHPWYSFWVSLAFAVLGGILANIFSNVLF